MGAAADAGSFSGKLAAPIVGLASPDAGGYWMAGSDGGILSFGNAPFLGSLPAMVPDTLISGLAAD